MKFLGRCKECFSANTLRINNFKWIKVIQSMFPDHSGPKLHISNRKITGKPPNAEGKKLGLVGWVQNTDKGTVQGQLQGPISKVRHMQEWLEKKGSPKSHIDRANFNNEKVILKLDYSDFQIVK
uniref:Acylphosphatase-1 n=1 Tax=Rousettus aegyptiacus TaxID=9407 RepID=A0A7J8IEZ3_ROUAE|nr:acylphosphatase 1 [Rousettus aegyptiacus]